MASRAYRRDSRGRFAGSGGRVTYGKAGGFANASHRAKAADARASAARRRALVGRGKAVAKALAPAAVSIGLRVGVSMAVGAAAKSALGGTRGGIPTRRRGIGSLPGAAKRRRGVYKITSL